MMIGWLIDWWMDGLFDWLIDWMVDWNTLDAYSLTACQSLNMVMFRALTASHQDRSALQPATTCGGFERILEPDFFNGLPSGNLT